MAGEIVKYDNKLNSISFRNFSKLDNDIFFAIVSRMRDKGLTTITFSFEEIADLTKNNQSLNRFKESLSQMKKRMTKIAADETSLDEDNTFVLFPTFKINKKKETVTVRVNEDLKYILNDLTTWTRFSLEQFVELKSSYSKAMFRLIKQWRTIGRVPNLTPEDFRRLLSIPKSYKSYNIRQTVIKPILKELSPIFKGLKIKEKTYKRKVISYTITFQKEKNNADDVHLYHKNLDNYHKKSIKSTVAPILEQTEDDGWGII